MFIVFSVELRIVVSVNMNRALMSTVMGLFFRVVAWIVHILGMMSWVMRIHFPLIVSASMVAVARVSMVVFEFGLRVG